MTISLEQLHDNSPADRNFHKLAQLVLDTGGKTIGIRFGTGTATWPGGGAASGTATINHGLATTPIAVLIQSRDTLFEYVVSSRSGTTIGVVGYITTNTVVAASSRTFDWAVIG